MTRDAYLEEFFATVEAELRLRHVPFDKRELEEFCRALSPLALEDDSPAWWADAFLEAQAAALTEGQTDDAVH